jgi:hypothetical protein
MADFDQYWEAVDGLIFFRKNCFGKTSTDIPYSSLPQPTLKQLQKE